jgi:hypothetical protein
MAITRLNNHDLHEVRIHLTEGNIPHYAALRCVDCNKQIQWLSQFETKTLSSAGITTYSNKNIAGELFND